MNYNKEFYEGLNDNRSTLYRQMDTVVTLNKLLSTIHSELLNLENYKINSIGNYILKQFLKNLIDKLNENKYEIQELIKIKNGFPIFHIEDIENISLIKTMASMDYKTNIILNNLNSEMKSIIKLTNEAISNAQKENDYQTILVLSKLLLNLNKSIIEIPQ